MTFFLALDRNWFSVIGKILRLRYASLRMTGLFGRRFAIGLPSQTKKFPPGGAGREIFQLMQVYIAYGGRGSPVVVRK